MVQLRGSGRANFKYEILLQFTVFGPFETYIDSSLNEISKSAPTAVEVNEISKIF